MSAYDFVKMIASKPRYAGTEGEKEACRVILNEFKNMGVEASTEPTEYIASETYLKAFSIVVAYVFFFFFVLAGFLHPLTMFIIFIGFLAFLTKLFPKIELKLAKTESQNIIGTINPEKERRLIICGHYDSPKVIGKFIQKHEKKLIKALPVLSLLQLLFLIILVVVGVYQLWDSGWDFQLLAAFNQGLNTGWLSYLWWFYVIFFLVATVFMTYLISNMITKKYAYGADDNGSGIAVILETARRLKGKELNMRVDFACFAAEERGLFGSRKWVNKHIHELDRDKTYVLNLDCVGRGEKFFLIKGLGIIPKKYSDPVLFEILKSACDELGYPYVENWGGGSDHVEFVRKKLKCCAFLRCDPEKSGIAYRILVKLYRIPVDSNIIPFMDWIHTEKDTLEHINEQRINESAQLTYRIVELLNERLQVTSG